MSKIHISYSRQDQKAVDNLIQDLRSYGIELDYDKDPSVGADYAASITNAITKCDAVIVFLSKDSLNSAWCRKEWEMAVTKSKPIIPISIGSIEKSKLPDYLQGVSILEYDSFMENPTKLRENLFHYASGRDNENASSPEPPLSSPRNGTVMPMDKNRVSPKHKQKKITWVIVFFILAIVVPVCIFQITKMRYSEKHVLSYRVKEQEDLDELEDLKTRYDEIEELQKEYEKNKQKIDSLHKRLGSLRHENDTITTQESSLSSQDDTSESNTTLEPLPQISQEDSTPDSIIQQQHSSSGEINPVNPNDTNLPMSPLPTAKQPLTEIILLFFLFASIIMTVLFILSRRKIKHLKTNLRIISDAKLQARIGKDNMLIEKDEELSVQMPMGEQKLNLDYFTFNKPKCINCFIAGSTNLQAERDALRATISVVYNQWQKKNFHIFSYTFEDFDRKFASDGQQPLYDYFIENEADAAVFIIKGDVGDYTVREFDKAYASYCKNKKPSIVVYNDKTANLAPSAMSLKARVETAHQFWIDYETLNELKLDFQEILSTDLWSLYEKELLASR